MISAWANALNQVRIEVGMQCLSSTDIFERFCLASFSRFLSFMVH